MPQRDAGAEVPIISHDHQNFINREIAQFWFAGPPKYLYFVFYGLRDDGRCIDTSIFAIGNQWLVL